MEAAASSLAQIDMTLIGSLHLPGRQICPDWEPSTQQERHGRRAGHAASHDGRMHCGTGIVDVLKEPSPPYLAGRSEGQNQLAGVRLRRQIAERAHLQWQRCLLSTQIKLSKL